MASRAGRDRHAGPPAAPLTRRGRWFLCGTLALLLHAGVLSNPFKAFESPPTAGAQRRTQPTALQTRRINPGPEPAAAAPEAPPLTPGEEDQSPPAAPAPPQDTVPERDPLPQGLIPPEDLPPPPPEGDAPVEFLSRSALSRGPVPMSAVLLTYPEIPDDPGHHVAVLTLFIDETGVVRKVTIESPGLPEALEGVARRAFLETRFRPGERDGVPVRARMRVEVRFDSAPAP